MKKRKHRVYPLFVAVAACMNFAAGESIAQTYPSKPVRLVVGFSPGGSADVSARLLADKLSGALGQQVVVENRPGASGTIANERVAMSAPDGYTLLSIGVSAIVTPMLRTNLRYDIQRDFAPVSLVAIAPFVLATHPGVPAGNVKELIALARTHPGVLNFGSVGAGSTPHLMGELFKAMADVNIVHVPFRGGAQNVVATAAGHMHMNFASIPSLLPFINSGKIKPLAVTTVRRASLLPAVPTIHESGLEGYDRSSWQGVLVPAAVPAPVIARLNKAIAGVMSAPDLRSAFIREGLEPQTTKPADFSGFMAREIAKNAALIKQIGLTSK